MNIFYLDKNPTISAQSHIDRHVVKMLLEYCQLLSTAHRLLDGNLETFTVVKNEKTKQRKVYILEGETFENNSFENQKCCFHSHINHPSGVWTRYSKKNYDYLYTLLVELHKEFLHRYPGLPDKVHKTFGMYSEFLKNSPKNIKDLGFTEPTPAMPDEFKIVGDSVSSYKGYYNGRKAQMASYKNRAKPNWFDI